MEKPKDKTNDRLKKMFFEEPTESEEAPTEAEAEPKKPARAPRKSDKDLIEEFKKKKTKERRVALVVRVDKWIDDQIRYIAEEAHISISDVVNELLGKSLKK